MQKLKVMDDDTMELKAQTALRATDENVWNEILRNYSISSPPGVLVVIKLSLLPNWLFNFINLKLGSYYWALRNAMCMSSLYVRGATVVDAPVYLLTDSYRLVSANEMVACKLLSFFNKFSLTPMAMVPQALVMSPVEDLIILLIVYWLSYVVQFTMLITSYHNLTNYSYMEQSLMHLGLYITLC